MTKLKEIREALEREIRHKGDHMDKALRLLDTIEQDYILVPGAEVPHEVLLAMDDYQTYGTKMREFHIKAVMEYLAALHKAMEAK